MKYLIIFGMLLNCALILINRYVIQFPSWLFISLETLGIILMVAGMWKIHR